MPDKNQDKKQVENLDKNQDKEQELSLEEAFGQLDGMLERLEDPKLALEESFSLYQRGMELLKQCNERIDTIEKKVFMMNGDGELEEF